MTPGRFTVLLQWDPSDRVWVTHVPALDYTSSFGDTREDALENTREAILGYLEAAEKEGLPAPTGGPDVELIDVEVAIA